VKGGPWDTRRQRGGQRIRVALLALPVRLRLRLMVVIGEAATAVEADMKNVLIDLRVVATKWRPLPVAAKVRALRVDERHVVLEDHDIVRHMRDADERAARVHRDRQDVIRVPDALTAVETAQEPIVTVHLNLVVLLARWQRRVVVNVTADAGIPHVSGAGGRKVARLRHHVTLQVQQAQRHVAIVEANRRAPHQEAHVAKGEADTKETFRWGWHGCRQWFPVHFHGIEGRRRRRTQV